MIESMDGLIGGIIGWHGSVKFEPSASFSGSYEAEPGWFVHCPACNCMSPRYYRSPIEAVQLAALHEDQCTGEYNYHPWTSPIDIPSNT